MANQNDEGTLGGLPAFFSPFFFGGVGVRRIARGRGIGVAKN